ARMFECSLVVRRGTADAANAGYTWRKLMELNGLFRANGFTPDKSLVEPAPGSKAPAGAAAAGNAVAAAATSALSNAVKGLKAGFIVDFSLLQFFLYLIADPDELWAAIRRESTTLRPEDVTDVIKKLFGVDVQANMLSGACQAMQPSCACANRC